MKKFISILSVMAFLLSGYVQAEQNEELISVCKEAADKDGVSAEMYNEYVENCLANISEDEQKDKEESK